MCCLTDSVCEMFDETISNIFVCGVIWLLNVMNLISVLKLLCWIDHVWSLKESVCGANDPSVHLECVCVCRMLSPHLRV